MSADKAVVDKLRDTAEYATQATPDKPILALELRAHVVRYLVYRLQDGKLVRQRATAIGTTVLENRRRRTMPEHTKKEFLDLVNDFMRNRKVSVRRRYQRSVQNPPRSSP